MTWFKGLQDNSIDSWGELCSELTSHFKARRKRSKTMTTLNAVVEDKKETLRECVDNFTRADVDVLGAHDGLKCFIFESNLRDECKLKEDFGLWAAKELNDLLMRAQLYINYKENKNLEINSPTRMAINGAVITTKKLEALAFTLETTPR